MEVGWGLVVWCGMNVSEERECEWERERGRERDLSLLSPLLYREEIECAWYEWDVKVRG